MHANYGSWKIDESGFASCNSIPGKINFLLRYGILAPSVNNSQPWLFSIRDNLLSIYINGEYRLPQADPFNRGLFISAGACLQNILIAARHYKLSYNVKIEPNLTDNFQKPVIEVVFSDNQDSRQEANDHDALFFYITSHKMNKFNYQKIFVLPGEFVDFCHKIAVETGCSLVIENDRNKIAAVSSVVSKATAAAFNKKEFRSEIGGWLRNNYTKKQDGMPMFTNGIPGLLSLIFPPLMSRVNPAKMLAKKSAQAVGACSAIGVLGGQYQSPVSWINCGRAFQTIELESQRLGLALAIMGAPVEVDNYIDQLKSAVGVDFAPALFFRIGRPLRVARQSPRRQIENFIINA